MRKEIRQEVGTSKTLDEVRDSLFGVFKDYYKQGAKKIGYVSGAVTADGPDKIPENIAILEKVTDETRKQQDFPVFCASDVFSDELFARLDAAGFVNADWEVFWRQIFEDPRKYVTDMFMSPGWERSNGARDELKSAKKMGMRVYYLRK